MDNKKLSNSVSQLLVISIWYLAISFLIMLLNVGSFAAPPTNDSENSSEANTTGASKLPSTLTNPKSVVNNDEQIKSRFEELELFNKILYMIESQYYRPISMERLIQGAIKGMMETLDPHSAFLDKEIFSKLQDDTSGEFGGLGIEIKQKDGVIYVITALEDTPAYRAGLRNGDKIVEIDHEPTLGITLEEAIKKMKGPTHSKVIIGIAREGVNGVKSIEIIREKIKVQPVKYELINERFAFIRLTQFQKGSANAIRLALKNIREKIKQNEKEREKEKTTNAHSLNSNTPNNYHHAGGLDGIILDLRFNPGGLLDEAVEVSSIFLSSGIVVSTEGRGGEKKEIRNVSNSNTNEKELTVPLVVLINGASASASEIVAGALQDHKRAIIMGQQSFGKGSVQTVTQIDENNGVKLTIAQYLTPLGRRIQALGISPDIELDEFEAAWLSENITTSRYIREIDLRNHLSATIETPEESEARLRQEKEARIRRIKEMEERKKSAEKEKESFKNSSKYRGKKSDSTRSNNNEDKFIDKNNDSSSESNDKSNKRDLDENNEEILKKYSPQNDFQVIQAVNYLKSFKIFKAMNATQKGNTGLMAGSTEGAAEPIKGTLVPPSPSFVGPSTYLKSSTQHSEKHPDKRFSKHSSKYSGKHHRKHSPAVTKNKSSDNSK